MNNPDPVTDRLRDLTRAVQARFEEQKRVLSFHEYLALVQSNAARFTRDAARYVKDCFDHFGSYEVQKPHGVMTRWRLFDAQDHDPAKGGPFASGALSSRREFLSGQEHVQNRLYRVLTHFVREGRVNRLMLVHGPNGSAKSTLVACMMNAMEYYSSLDEGALYRFSWIFPRQSDERTIGFGSSKGSGAADGRMESFAHLPPGQVDAKVVSELREHPLFLIPVRERQAFIAALYATNGVQDPCPEWVWQGQLGTKNKQIFEALLTAHSGDLNKVWAHVQVERYYISRRYRVGAVTLGPEMAADAHERQITADRTLHALPAPLSSLSLYESFGELVDASGGMLEYSDILKRPLDAWKYLLLAIETGEVPLSMTNVPLNEVLVATTNELHLQAFREHHEYNSFRSRIQFVRMGYLLSYLEEQAIYDTQIVPQFRKHVAPHTTFVLALWGVLTRVKRADPDAYAERPVGVAAQGLSPLEKAELYATGKTPSRLAADETALLRRGVSAVLQDGAKREVYEGLTGVSPRELRGLLLDAAQDPRYDCVSPLAVLEQIQLFCERRDYEFLRETPNYGYADHRGFVDQVRGKWLDRVDDELRSASGLVDERRYLDLFDRYITHISFWLKKERVYHRLTGKEEDPDLELMQRLESLFDAGSNPDEFRRTLINTLAAHAIDHPGEKADYAQLFPRYIERLKEDYFRERRKQLAGIAQEVLKMVALPAPAERGGDLDSSQLPNASTESARVEPSELDRELQEQATRALEYLGTLGYEHSSLRVALGELVRDRYSSYL